MKRRVSSLGTEKGVIKDLIISGDTAFQMTLERFEQGDKESIIQFCKTLSARKGTVDLLENMDLDFAFEDKSTAEAFLTTASNSDDKVGAPYVASKGDLLLIHIFGLIAYLGFQMETSL